MAHAETHHGASQGVEPEAIHAGHVMKITAVTFLLMAIVVVAGFQIAHGAFRESTIATTQVTGYPKLRETQEQGLQKISEYGVVSAEAGRYRIPVDRAIDLMVNEAAAARASD